jgi:predicted AlkP superfamily pyrophosphatase or phosphodiesterase
MADHIIANGSATGNIARWRAVKRLAALLLAAAVAPAAPAAKPRLVLTITVDQFRYDYLTRFDAEYKGGLRRLLDRGAVFTSARYDHFPTVTAVGHSTVATGAFPSTSGIIGNEWFDRETGRSVESTYDPSAQLLGGTGEASSPRRLLVSTVGDELKVSTGGRAKVFGISQKARAAILSSGHTADGAFWFDAKGGAFVSSTFYFADLPAWVKEFNAARPVERFRQEWAGRPIPPETAAGNEMVEGLAERAIEAESLGGREVTDLLALSFSANDAVGHEFGPDSPEVHAISLATDRALDRLFRFLDARVGMDHVLVVLTADHGVAPVPEENAARRMPGGRLPPGLIRAAVQAALTLRYGAGQWISGGSELAIYLNRRLEMEKGLDVEEVEKTAEQAALTMPHVSRVYTRGRLLRGEVPLDPVGRAVLHGFNVQRSPDLAVLLDPYWMLAARGTTHGSAYGYDEQVPIVFMGPGIRAGRFYESALVNDIAPTLASMLEIAAPSGSAGRVLGEILK